MQFRRAWLRALIFSSKSIEMQSGKLLKDTSRRRTPTMRKNLRNTRVKEINRLYVDIPTAIDTVFRYFKQTFKLPPLKGGKRWPCHKSAIAFEKYLQQCIETFDLSCKLQREAVAYLASMGLMCAIDRVIFTMYHTRPRNFGHEKAILILTRAVADCFKRLIEEEHLTFSEKKLYENGYRLAWFLYHVPSIDINNTRLSNDELEKRIDKRSINAHYSQILGYLERVFHKYEVNGSQSFSSNLTQTMIRNSKNPFIRTISNTLSTR